MTCTENTSINDIESQDLCKTKYPILFIHGTGFRDHKIFNYWGRIPSALENHGAEIFYGHQDSWATIKRNAEIIKANLIKTIEETGCEKVNIIAHSKGGIEARYLASSMGCERMIASITTISTPHNGSKTMDKIWKLLKFLIRFIAVFANLWFRILGDKHPDFYHACEQFTTEFMCGFNNRNPDMENIYYQSYATIMKNPFSDMLMFFLNLIIGLIEGENDGLVTPESAVWTNFKGVWRSLEKRGISHADSVDLRRKNFTKREPDSHVADIRTCYIKIVSMLKNMEF